jgi:hypothetical protein
MREGVKYDACRSEMIKMEIESIRIEDIKPYENNPRFNDEAVEGVKESIKQFGFKIPMVIDKNNVIVCGHTRYKASVGLGLKEIPCIRADDLTDEQIRAFRIADNKVSEVAEWDLNKLQIELEDISLDMSSFGVDLESFEPVNLPDDEDEDDGWYGDERERTNKAYNLDLIDYENLTNDFWQMPTIKNDHFIPDDLIGFNYALSSKNRNCGVHFYVDDYQFERVWHSPEKYVEVLWEYDCILSPDFSLYMDMPMPMKIWNIYRSRQIGAFYQSRGIKVIPTISWAEAETFEFCFQGIPKGSVVSVSTVGVKEKKDALKVWHEGMTEMIKRIEPSTIIVYGGKIDFDYGDIKTVYFENKVTENWKKGD